MKLLLLGVTVALAGCARSPSPEFYVLSSHDGAVVAGRRLQVELRRPSIPSYLDRPHIVRRVTPERLELDADQRWGGNLEEMVGATLAADLSQRLPSAVVYTETGSISSAPDVRLELALSRFELTEGGTVSLVAEVATRWSTVPESTAVQRYELRAQPNGSSTGDVVASLSGLLGRLSDAIVHDLQAGPPAPLRPLPNETAASVGLAR